MKKIILSIFIMMGLANLSHAQQGYYCSLKRILHRLASSFQSWLMTLKVPTSEVFFTCVPKQRHSS